jgi:hypothetical protein
MTQFSGRMRDFYENVGFDIEFRGQTRRYRYIAAVMITHVYINENLKYEPFVKYMTKTLSHRPKALQSHESDGVIFF